MYQVIYADPPWYYNSRKAGGERKNKTKFGGGAEKHYPLMIDQELLDMAPWIRTLAEDNCALFMWVTMPRLDFGIELMKEWGFRYCTNAFTWIKTKRDGGCIYGPGYYTASNPELCLIGVKGSMKPTAKMIPSVIMTKRMEHSKKPESVRHNIEAMYPNAKKIELFARTKSNGWDSWGKTGAMSEGDFL